VKKNNAPSAADLMFLVLAPLIAIRGSVKLTQSDGDMIAHIRMGNTILRSGHLPAHSLASYTAPADQMVAHGWLSEIIFALLFRAGGLPLLAVITAIIIALTHGAIAIFLRKRGVDPRWAFLAALLSLALGSTHWLTRPHMFSIVGSAFTLFLLEYRGQYRQLLFFPLFALWANLHGGWAYGLTVIAAYIAGDLAEAFLSEHDAAVWLRQARRNSVAFAIAAASTLLNPYGLELHREVLFAVTSNSLATQIAEYMPPNFRDVGQWPFLLALLSTIVLFSLGRKRINMSWLFVILISTFFSLRSFRNIALFGVTAWPLIALHASMAIPKPLRRFPYFNEFARLDPNSRYGLFIVPVGILLLALGLHGGRVGDRQVIAETFNNKKFPVAAIERARESRLEGNVFDAWGWAGYIMYAWPEARLHVDPLKFNDTTIKSYTIIEDLQPGWQREIARWQIKTIIVGTKSPTARGLAMEPAWKVWYQDSTATVFRPSSDPQS
jgi:hypothetical protein